jgi:hypothetical protein
MIDTLKKEFGKFIFYPVNDKCESYIFDEEIESCLVLMGHNSGYYSKKSFSNCIVKTFFPREITIETHGKLYENLTFSYCVFSNFDFKGIEFDSVQFKNCVFLDCKFEFVKEPDYRTDYVQFENCMFEEKLWSEDGFKKFFKNGCTKNVKIIDPIFVDCSDEKSGITLNKKIFNLFLVSKMSIKEYFNSDNKEVFVNNHPKVYMMPDNANNSVTRYIENTRKIDGKN